MIGRACADEVDVIVYITQTSTNTYCLSLYNSYSMYMSYHMIDIPCVAGDVPSCKEQQIDSSPVLIDRNRSDVQETFRVGDQSAQSQDQGRPHQNT